LTAASEGHHRLAVQHGGADTQVIEVIVDRVFDPAGPDPGKLFERS
jgi:hypothetical protein